MKVVQLCGYKNSGKTTLITGLIPQLKKQGLKTAVIKHDGHGFDIDQEGTDTYKFREAGAEGIAIASPSRTAIMRETELDLESLISLHTDFDLVLIEGYKKKPYPKLVMLRNWDDLTLVDELEETRGVVVRPEMVQEPSASLKVRQRLTVPVYTWNDTEQITAMLMSM